MIRWRDPRRFLGPLGAALLLVLALLFATPAASYLRGAAVDLFASREVVDPELASLSRAALADRVRADEAELSHIRYQAVFYGLLADENARLTELLHGTSTPKGILARVVTRPPRTLYDTILVDRGAEDGIAEGDAVSVDGIALGRIVSVGRASALVELFSSPGTEEDALLGAPRAIVVAKGLGGGAFELSIPRGVSVVPGDLIRAGTASPLVLGIVASVSTDPSDSSQSILARSPVSLADLDFVEIAPATPL